MKRFPKDFVDRLQAKAATRRRRALQTAVAERKLREDQEGSIWKSGKGGAHYDR
jgi:hypothetical protein